MDFTALFDESEFEIQDAHMRVGFFGKIFVTTLTILAIPYVVPGVYVDGIWAAFLGALCLLLFNFTLKPLLIILTFPLTVLSLGLFLFIVNALVFSVVDTFVSGIHIESFASSFWAALLMTVVSWVLNLSIAKDHGRRVIVVDSNGRRVRDVN